MNDLQAKLFEIYIEFKRVCDELKIGFFAAGGTLLGAVRHGGFIPWDDDIDIYMFRDDYEKLIKNCSLFNHKYFLQSHETDKKWFLPFSKLRDTSTVAIESAFSKVKMNHGLWIDIFPLDVAPKRKSTYRFNSFFLKLYLKRTQIYYKNIHSFKHFVIAICSLFVFPSKRIGYRFLNSIFCKPNNRTVFYSYCSWDYLFKKEWLETFSYVKFENGLMRIPTEYDKLLTFQYGDWRTPPKNDSQKKSGHTIIYIDLSPSSNNKTNQDVK